MKITRKTCELLYLEYTNNYLTLQSFADRMNCTRLVNEEKPVAFYQSIINRGKIAFHGASYSYFTGITLQNIIKPDNRACFNKRRIERLLLEHSA